MTTDVTVLSVWYNRAGKVDASIQSLVDQTYPGFRAIVVDDASRDDTLTRLRRFGSDRITVRGQPNAGFTRTMMTLCAEADTEFIAVHGAGDESLPQRLAAQRAFLIAHPGVVVVGCGIENVDEISGRRWDVLPRDTVRKGPIAGAFGISHGEIMFRRDAYLRAGGYRDSFAIGQASDLFRRMSRLGDFGYVPEVLYRRYLMADGVSADAGKVAQRAILAALSTSVHHREVAANRPTPQVLKDDIDRFGMLLPYLAAPDASVARALASAAIMYWSSGDRRVGLRLARRSLGERGSLFGLVATALIAAGVGPLRKPALAVARKVSRGEGEFALGRLSGRD